MQIDFYEEFPTKDNLEKLKLIKFKSRIFIAAKSLSEFNKIARQAKRINKNLKYACWLIIKNSYWISPFSNTKDLIELFNELEKMKNPLLIDLELPLKSKWKMYVKNIFSFKRNKKLIKKFIEKNKNRITTAQYIRAVYSKFAKFLGLDYNINAEKSLMCYTSMMKKQEERFSKCKISQIKDKQNYSISLGTIATGILGNEPILSPEKLENDLEFVRNVGFKKVVIFRLGGLNKEYLKVIKKFI